MDSYITILGIALVVSAIVGVLTYFAVKSRAQALIRDAETQAEMIKKEKALQAKEKFIQLRSEHDRAVNERNQKVKEAEQRVRQAEQAVQQQQKELERKIADSDKVKAKMEAQIAAVEERKAELAQLMSEQNARLEQISGMSSEEAKNTLIENMKAEAKSEAAAYINETIEEAKLTATKEAKRIIVASIQRVATETAIENAVTVFNIDSEDVKGRIIGREGRNIRALEAATGIEIIVDDTPEAIILSGFDPVRREIARLALHQLVTDGRIHPARIEEVVAKVKKQIEEEIVEEPAFVRVEVMPSFMGGDLNTFRAWFSGEFKIPAIAAENGIQGNVVIKFVVEKDGKLSNIQVLQSPDKTLSEAAIAVLQKSPKWKPGKQRNKPVRVTYTLPVSFKIQQ